MYEVLKICTSVQNQTDFLLIKFIKCYLLSLSISLSTFIAWLNVNKTIFQLKGSVKELNKFHNYEAEKITRKASDAAEYIELFGSSARDRHTRCI